MLHKTAATLKTLRTRITLWHQQSKDMFPPQSPRTESCCRAAVNAAADGHNCAFLLENIDYAVSNERFDAVTLPLPVEFQCLKVKTHLLRRTLRRTKFALHESSNGV